MSRALIIVGLLIVLIGLLWPWVSKLPLGHLPGDIVIKKQNMAFYFPITTMLLVSAILSLIFWFLNR